jgi:ATP-dependent Zn protease
MHEIVPADAGSEPPKKLQGPMFQDMHGYGAAKDWGLELARDLEDYAASIITWDDVDSGLLLSGPPGCGKTTFAEALANSCGVELVVGSYSTWQSAGHQGDMLKAMVKTFDRARGKAPCILLVDEVDSFTDREKDHHNQDYMRGVVNGFLEQLDGAKGREGVIVIGACNNPAVIDPAIVRSGRLDRHIEIGLPDAPAREHILRYHLQTALDVSAVISRTEGLSGADLERTARDARRLARRQRVPVSIEHVAAALPEMHRLSHDELLSTAVHELGHAVVGIALGHRKLKRIVVKKELVTAAASQSMGYASFEARFAERKTKTWFEDKICLYLGSVAAENLFFGGHCDGAAQDLQQATDAATYMLAVAGLGKRLVSEGVGGDLALIRQRDFRLDPAVEEVLHEQRRRAAEIIERYRDVIEHLAHELAKTGEIDGGIVTRAVLEHGKRAQLALANQEAGMEDHEPTV